MVTEPVHQLADQKGSLIRTKCGKDIDRKRDKTSRASIWWTDVTCSECEPDEPPRT